MSVTMRMRRAALRLLVLAAGLLLAVAAVQIATPSPARGRHPLLTARGDIFTRTILPSYRRHNSHHVMGPDLMGEAAQVQIDDHVLG
jgi:hypothetical protein